MLKNAANHGCQGSGATTANVSYLRMALVSTLSRALAGI